MSELVPCVACSRHIRSTETACPFCRALAEPVAAEAAPAVRGSMRLSRAALALAGMTALTACGKEAQTKSLSGGPVDTNMAAPYGAPPLMFDAEAPPVDAATDAGTDAGKAPAPKPTPNIVSPPAPAYGGPPPRQ